MANKTLPTLTTAASLSGSDIILSRISGQTQDQQLKAETLLAYVSGHISTSVTADQITDATTVGKALLRAATTAAAQSTLGATNLGKALLEVPSTAAAQNLLEATPAGLGIFKAATTAAQQNLLEAGAVGLQVWKTGTTAAAQDALGGTTFGKAIFQATTTAAAQGLLETGVFGLKLWKTATTAAAQNLLEATTPGLGIFKAATTAAQQNLLEAGTVGLLVWKTNTTAAAQDALGGTTFGKAIFQASTTAAAQNLLEAGTVGLQLFKAATTVAATDLLGVAGSTYDLLGTAIASASASLDFTSLITSTYDFYIFVAEDIRGATDAAEFCFRTASNNSTFDSGAANYLGQSAYATLNGSGTAETFAALSGTTGRLTAGGWMSNATDGGYSGIIELLTPLGTARSKVVLSRGYISRNALTPYSVRTMFCRDALTAVNAIQFLMSSGNITSGKVKMYGVKA